ncbi:MAG TPA: tetratricopeptide repeat protein, partial [Coleofasciculaceae cyanobacterium]
MHLQKISVAKAKIIPPLFLSLLSVTATLILPQVPVSSSASQVLAQTPDAQNYHANLLLNLGIRQHKTGQFAAAIESLQKAVLIYQNLSDVRGVANCFSRLGDTYFSLGKYGQAADFYQRSLVFRQAIGDRNGEVEALSSLSNAYLYLGEEQEAKKLEQQAEALRREIGNPRRQAAFLNNLALDSQSQGEYQQAMEFHQQQLKIARELGNPALEAESLQKLAQAYESQGQYQKAVEIYQQQLEIAKNTDNPTLAANTQILLANAYRNLGQTQNAIELYQQQLDIARKSSDREQESLALNQLASAYESQGEYPKAIELYQQQLDVAKKSGNRLAEGTTLNTLALALLKSNNPTAAQPTLLDALKVWDAIRAKPGSNDSYIAEQAKTYRLLQQALIAQNQPEAALEIAEQSRVKAIVGLLGLRLSSEPVGTGLKAAPPQFILPTVADIKKIARSQKATLVKYSLISDNELYVWVVQASGEITFRSIDIKTPKSIYPISSLEEVVSSSLETIGVKGKSNKVTAEATDKTTQNKSLLQLHQ